MVSESMLIAMIRALAAETAWDERDWGQWIRAGIVHAARGHNAPARAGGSFQSIYESDRFDAAVDAAYIIEGGPWDG